MSQTQAPMPVVVNPDPQYAGFWRRVAAVIVDGLLLGIIGGGLGAILHLDAPSGATGWQSRPQDALSALIGLFYYVAMESSHYQATLGKMALSIKVTDIEGNKITLAKAIIRYLSKILSGIILGIGFLMVAFTEKKQGLHDMIAGTLVVKK